MASGFVDPTKAGKYPVVLSDALLGKSNSKEVYTGLRYNHRPTENAPSLARLKPNVSSKSSYDLSYNDNGIYKFQGNRSTGDGQYVLIFDPQREVFVLHKLDSLFNMNLIRTPTNNDAESLRREYPHIEGTNISTSGGNNNLSKTKAAPKDTATDKGSGMLTMPEPGPPPKKLAPPPPKKREPASDEEDDEEEDDDDDILIEVPGDDGRNANHDFSPAFAPRRFSEFVHASEEEEDADGEDDDESMDHFTLPSPLNRQAVQHDNSKQNTHQMMEVGDVESEEDEEEEQPQQHLQYDQDEEDTADFGMDELEAELEAELEGEFGGGNQSESEMSEED